MTPEELEALAKIEERLKLPGLHLPKTSAELTWLCTLVRRLSQAQPGKPKKLPAHEAALAKQAARIAELEGMLGLTPEVVLAAERKRLEAEL